MKTLNFPHGLSGKGDCRGEGSAITSHTSPAFPHLLQRAREASGQSQPDLALYDHHRYPPQGLCEVQ